MKAVMNTRVLYQAEKLNGCTTCCESGNEHTRSVSGGETEWLHNLSSPEGPRSHELGLPHRSACYLGVRNVSGSSTNTETPSRWELALDVKKKFHLNSRVPLVHEAEGGDAEGKH